MVDRSSRSDTAPSEEPRPAARPRRTQEERRAETRSRLLAAAVDCICELGYAEVTVADVAQRAGLTRGAVQHHFGNRDDLCLAIVDAFGHTLDSWDRSMLDARRGTVAERVGTAIDQYWESFRNPQFVAVVLIWFGVRNNKDVYAVLAHRMNEFERKFDDDWQALFADTGLPRTEIAAARHIALSALRGLALRKIYRKARAGLAQELDLLKRMLTAALSKRC
jgi:AcrR family transcriptional regulator